MKIVVPDDHPSIFAGSKAHELLLEVGSIEIHDSRPGSDVELIDRHIPGGSGDKHPRGRGVPTGGI